MRIFKLPMKRHIMHAETKYFDLLENGSKKFEFRLNDEKRKNITVGDVIEFRCTENPSRVTISKVIGIKKSEDFEILLRDIRQGAIGGIKKIEQIKKLNEIYSKEKINDYGVMAIELGKFD